MICSLLFKHRRISSRMRGPASSVLKQEFVKKWAMGLEKYSWRSKKDMNILERKNAIKLSADLAMASARNGTTCWSRAVIANASKDGNNKALVDHILGNECAQSQIKASSIVGNKRSKKMLKSRSCSTTTTTSVGRVVKKRAVPHHMLQLPAEGSIAKRLMVKKRTNVLKTLIPGGESMDGLSLMEETLDYIVSLRAQVDVMRHLANSA